MIKSKIKQRISNFYKENPIAIGEKATTADIKFIENTLNLKLDEDYIDFISSFGGGVLGNKEIYSIKNSEIIGDENIIEINERYKNDDWEGIEKWLIIGTDHSGNPIGIDTNGKIVSNDHDFGGIFTVAESFEDYLRKILEEIENSK